jgi:hypothetical protein
VTAPNLSIASATPRDINDKLNLVASRLQNLDMEGLLDAAAIRYRMTDGSWSETPTQYRARAFRTTNQSLANNTVTTITFDAESYDLGGFHSGGTFTIPLAGTYVIAGQLKFAAGVGTSRIISALLNGTVIAVGSYVPTAAAGVPTSISCYTEMICAAGDAVTFQGFQNSGGALNATGSAAASESFGIVRLI